LVKNVGRPANASRIHSLSNVLMVHAPDAQRIGSQISVLSSVGGTIRASFKYSSTVGALSGSSPLCASQLPYNHL
jgi:hypothetical protein